MEDSTRRATANKRLHVNQRVSGSVGEYIEGPTKRRRRQRLYGHIISAIGERKYMVRFDDGSEKECSSALLRVEKMHTNVPPDIQMPTETTLEHRVVLHDLEEEVVDQEEEEPLGASPDDEEMEEVLAEATQDDGDPPNGMPGQLPTEKEQPLAKDYTAIKMQALEIITSLVGEKVTIKTRNNGAMTWTVIASHDPPDVIPEKEHNQYGLKGFKVENFKRSEVLCSVFLMLLFKDWRKKVEKLNVAVATSKAKCRPFTEKEFLTGLAILIGAAEFAKRGSDLFSVKDQFMEEGDDDDEKWPSLCPEPHFEKYMSFGRWKDFRRYFPEIFADETRKETDVWYQFSAAVDEFNEIRSTLICGSRWISVDETMCAWKPRKTATGGLPNISFIIRKPEPLGKRQGCMNKHIKLL
jgi:hypothetical protein